MAGLPIRMYGLSLVHTLVFLGLALVKLSNLLIYIQIETVFVSLDSWLQLALTNCYALFYWQKQLYYAADIGCPSLWELEEL